MLNLRGVLVPLIFLAGNAAGAEWQPAGDLRAGVFASEREARDGTRTDLTDARARLRLSLTRAFAPGWQFRARLASRVGSEQDGMHAYLRGYVPTSTGTRLGDTTLDEFHLEIAPPEADWAVRVGRFQSKFELMGVASKSLDLNDSPSTNVTWTDGVHWRHEVLPGWRTHLLLQHNHRRGSGTAARAPLDFSDRGSRVGLFAGLEASEPRGPWVQRMIGLTWLPDALAADGPATPVRDDYIAITARAAVAWPVGADDRRLLIGAEAGHAPRTPRGTVVGVGNADRSGGDSWQVSANIEHLAPGHHVGVVYGRAEAGWLLSPNFRNNERLAEIRYQRRFSPSLSLEARYRWREELEIPAGSVQARVERDVYLRMSMRF